MAELSLKLAVGKSQELETSLSELIRLVELFPDEVPKIASKFLEPNGLFELKAEVVGVCEMVLHIVPSLLFASFVSALKKREAAL